MNSSAYDKQKLHCSIYFSLSICTLPYLGCSFIQYHLYASALFISPTTENISIFGHFSRSAKTITYSLLEYKRCIDIYEHKKMTKLKKIPPT